jgi:hypothetical protein
MVFVDTNTERTSKEIHMPMEVPGAVSGEVDYYEITGLNRDHKIDPEIWESIKGGSGASEQERAREEASIAELAEKKQFERQAMGDKQWW